MKKNIVICDSCGKDCTGDVLEVQVSFHSHRGMTTYFGPSTDRQGTITFAQAVAAASDPKNWLGLKQFCGRDCFFKAYQ